MDIMESLLGERPFMLSPAIAFSSDTHINRSKSNNESNTSSSANEFNDIRLKQSKSPKAQDTRKYIENS